MRLENEALLPLKFPIKKYFKLYNTRQSIDSYVLSFTPKEYGDKFQLWLKETDYINHPDFICGSATLKLWKRDSGEIVTNEDLSALLEWLKYNTDYLVIQSGFETSNHEKYAFLILIKRATIFDKKLS